MWRGAFVKLFATRRMDQKDSTGEPTAVGDAAAVPALFDSTVPRVAAGQPSAACHCALVATL